MTRLQINRQNMHLAVLQFLNDNNTIVQSEPLVAEAANIFKPIVAQITMVNQERKNSDSTGYTANKNNALDAAFTLAASICLKAKPYARKINDAVLLKAIDHTFSDLHDIADDKGLTTCNAIVTALQPHLTALLPYKITQATLTDLSAAISTATPKAAERDVVNANSVNSTAQLRELFIAAKTALIELDDLIEGQLIDDHKAFVDTYFVARRVNDIKGGGGKVEEVKG